MHSEAYESVEKESMCYKTQYKSEQGGTWVSLMKTYLFPIKQLTHFNQIDMAHIRSEIITK